MACSAPNPSLGTIFRLTEFMDCHAEAIGREGFLALAGYSVGSGLLGALLTIFVALIGYRLIIGDRPGLADGAGWLLRVGVILALLTGWTAFQTLFYDLGIAAPTQLAERIAGGAGIPDAQIDARTQRAYDSLRLGLQSGAAQLPGQGSGATPLYVLQTPMPQTAAFFMVTVSGLAGAAKLTSAFLLAIAPLPILAVLFAPGMGLFFGWLRALVTVIFANAGLVLSGLICLLAIESELSRMQALGIASAAQLDQQAPVAVITIFFLLSLALVFVSARLSGAIATMLELGVLNGPRRTGSNAGWSDQPPALSTVSGHKTVSASAREPDVTRVTALTDSLQRTVLRETRGPREITGQEAGPFAGFSGRSSSQRMEASGSSGRAGGRTGGGRSHIRRALGRRHRSTARRDNRE